MSDLRLQIQPTSTLAFEPNELTLRVLSADILSGMSLVYFELRDTNLNNSRYVSRDWVDKGTVQIPTAMLLAAVDNTDPEHAFMKESVTDMLLNGFNLELISTEPLS